MTLGEFSILTLVAAAIGAAIYYGRACYANGVYDAMLEHDEPDHPGAKRARRIMQRKPTTHQERVIKEKSVVDRNLAKLMTFRSSAKFRDVEPDEQLPSVAE